MDKAYQARFTNGLLGLMMETGMTETAGTRVAYMPAGEIIDTFVTTIALLMRDSEATANPRKTRETCDQLARKLQTRINAAKQQPSPFETMPVGPLN